MLHSSALRTLILYAIFVVVVALASTVWFTEVFVPHDLSAISLHNGSWVTMRGRIDDEIVPTDQGVRVKIAISHIHNGKNFDAAHGNVMVNSLSQPTLHYGDEVEVSCALRAPQPAHGIAYDRIAAKDGIFSECAGVRPISVISSTPISFRGTLFFVKEVVTARSHELFSEPNASFIRGILYGDRATLDPGLKKDFQTTGTSHILAISGYNITIIITIISALIIRLRVRRPWSLLLMIGFVVAFSLISGGGGSVVRAALMGLAPHGAKLLGRRTHPLYLLALVVVIMIAFNPLILLYDAGFELSVVATWGMIVLTPRLSRFGSYIPLFAREIVVTSTAAFVATAPLIAFLFKQISLIGIVTNVVVLPAIPVLMATSATALALAFVWMRAGEVFAYIPTVIAQYCITVIHACAGFRFAAMRAPWFGAGAMIIVYGAFLVYLFFSRDDRNVV